MGSVWKHFLHLLIAVSITFCSRTIQTSPVASWIHQYSCKLGLFNRRTAAKQSNRVIDWLLVATYQKKWNFTKFSVHFNAHFVCSVFPKWCKIWRWVRWETEWPFDVQLCHEYVYQKLLKLDNRSSSYSLEKFGVYFYASVYMAQHWPWNTEISSNTIHRRQHICLCPTWLRRSQWPEATLKREI